MLGIRVSLLAVLGILCWVAVPIIAEDEEGLKPGELFKTLDKNSDGKLTKDEVGKERAKFFDRLIRVSDKDKNGELSREEFANGLKPDNKPVADSGQFGQARRGRGNFNPKQIFERLDRNKDGKLTKDELPEDARRRLAPLFERLGKEEITQEDFAKLHQASAGRRPSPEELIKRFDKNGDGKVSLDEVPEQLRPRIKPLFDRLGKVALNKDDLAKAFKNRPEQPSRRKEGDKRNSDRPRKVQKEGDRPKADSRRREGDRPKDGDRPRDGQRRRAEGRPQPGPDGFRGPIIFQKLDTNKDHKISKEELAKAADLFDELDKNKDGYLDPSELLGPSPRRPGREGDRPRRPNDERPKRPEGDRPNAKPRDRKTSDQPRQAGRQLGNGEFVKRIFDRFDTNNDGKLSKEEAPERLKENFSKVDANGDGSVDREELTNRLKDRVRQFRGKRPEKENRPKKN